MSPPHPTTSQSDGYEPSNAELLRYVTRRFDTVDRKHDELCSRLEVVETALVGSIKPPRQGFFNRVRTLERQIGAVRKLAWAALIAAAGVIGTWVANKFTGRT